MNNIPGRIVRFGLVGCTGIIIDFSVTWFCKEKMRLNKFAANGAGFIVSVINNYILNRIWTFKDSQSAVLTQFFLFVLISFAGLALNTAFVYLLHEKKRLPFYWSKALAIAGVFCWNFTANSLFTFHYH